MTDSSPFPFQWDGDAMVPPNAYWKKRADERFVVGQHYRMVEHHDRSEASHRHYFAALHEAWSNLPPHYAERFPSSEHLRKWALVKAGYRDEAVIVTATPEEAMRLAATTRRLDGYAVILVDDAVVTIYTAESQSMRAMGKQRFEESKQAVLGIVADLIGASVDELSRNAEQAA